MHDPHPNIVNFFGFLKIDDDRGIVSAYYENGNVNQYLIRNASVDRITLVRASCSCNAPFTYRLSQCKDVARGLRHLHVSVIHGDVKPVR